jgi:hypothetical protein
MRWSAYSASSCSCLCHLACRGKWWNLTSETSAVWAWDLKL